MKFFSYETKAIVQYFKIILLICSVLSFLLLRILLLSCSEKNSNKMKHSVLHVLLYLWYLDVDGLNNLTYF